jgi:transposase-like protein
MPWKNELPMEQKQRFINLAQSGRFTVSELSEEFGITRKTGHKWLLRYAGGDIFSAKDLKVFTPQALSKNSSTQESLPPL